VDDTRSDLKGVLAGMLLGDGCIIQTKSTCCFRMQHSEKQREYFKYKVSVLENLTYVTVRDIPPRGARHPNIEMVATTRTHPIYKRLREIFYKEGKRHISRCFMDWMTIEGLALWYMDDGTLQGTRNCVISVAAFPIEEVELLVKILYEKFGLAFRIISDFNKKQNKLYYKISAGGEAGTKFIEMIRPYIHETMLYKIDNREGIRMRAARKGKSQSELCGNTER
jgi:hypothetical protein